MTRAAYLNASAVQCEVPEGYLGDWQVATTHDDRLFSSVTSTITYYNPHETAILSPNQKMAIGSIQSGYIRLVLGVVEPDTNKPSITMAGSNFAPFERGCGADGWTSSIPGSHCSQKLCRFGPEALPRSEIMIPDNNTDPLNLLENVVPACSSTVNEYVARRRAAAWHTLQVHVL